MRHLIFALMIALLPLRGWMGDAMATQMAVQALQTAQAPAGLLVGDEPASSGLTAQHHGAAASFAVGMASDCATHVSDDSASGGAASVDANCENCPACQACHTVALSAVEHRQAAHAPPGPIPGSSMMFFASADPASGQKPPIS